MNKTLNVRKLETFVYRYPLATPVQTSFGLMQDRPMVLVRVTDADGFEGWGEVWCNFPSVGAEHRKRIIDHILAPMFVGEDFDRPQSIYSKLTRKVEILAIQSAEPGPFAQAIAGIDQALWDLASKRQEIPLWQYLGGHDPVINVYASGLNPTNPEQLAAKKMQEGHRGFKLKIGFGEQRDCDNLRILRSVLGEDVKLMVDANQGWDLITAKKAVTYLDTFNLTWLEEPLKVTSPLNEWQELSESSNIPLAGGENLVGTEQFNLALNSGTLKFIQPDLAKWGGFSACLPTARDIVKSSACFCPHYLGGGIGLLASAHLLAAVGGDGMLEIDANENPLRSELCGPLNIINNGKSTLSEEPGLGFTPNIRGELEQYLIS